MTAVAPGCAHPETMSVGLIPSLSILGESPGAHIELLPFSGAGPTTTEWGVPPGYLICSTHLQLADGSVVPPTHVFPYPTPTPTGGQYDEAAGDPASALNTLTITATKSPVRPGTNCQYPEESSLIGTINHGPIKSRVSVNIVEVSPTRLRLKLKPHRASLVLCPTAHIFLWLVGPADIPARRLVFTVSVKPHGGLSSTVTVPSGSYTPNEQPPLIEAVASARVIKTRK